MFRLSKIRGSIFYRIVFSFVLVTLISLIFFSILQQIFLTPLPSQLRILLLVLVSFSALISLGVGIYLARSISRPILKLSREIKEVSKGHLERKVKISTGDELEDLANAFNEMIEGLGKSQKELQERIRELERFGKMAIGRELKMVELKKEIKSLKRKLEGSHQRITE